jgi:hypothetical protein
MTKRGLEGGGRSYIERGLGRADHHVPLGCFDMTNEQFSDFAQRSEVHNQQQTLSSADGNAPRTVQRPQQHVKESWGIEALLGSEVRAPTFSIQTLTASQLYATGTRDRPPDRRTVGPGDYFSDGFNRKLMSTGENPLATAFRAAANLPDRVTISIGKEGKGAPGRTPLFSLTMVEFSRKGIGVSETVGIGANRGAFLSVSTVNGERSWSVGLFAGSPKAVAMGSINVTELVKKGELSIDGGALFSAGRGEVEISVESHPVEEAVEVLSNVLGPVLSPLSNYRNFQDPLHGM